VNVSVDETEVRIDAEDSLRPERPRTVLRLIARNIIEWIAEKFDRFEDLSPSQKFRFRLRGLHEFRPRPNDTDPDFLNYGINPTIDTVVASYNFENDSDVEPFSDYGSLPVYSANGNTTAIPDPTAFRRAFRVATRFGHGRLSRVILTFIATNIKNGIGDGEVTIPGGVSFNINLENIAYVANDTSIALEFDVDLDYDEGVLENNATKVERDSDGLQLSDDTEGRVTLDVNETRRIRWKRRVFCDGNKEVVVRARFVKIIIETPAGFVVRKKLFITFHIGRSARCHRLLWDPSTDIAPEDDAFVGPTGTTGTTGGTTGTTGTTGSTTGTTGGSTASTGSTSSSSKLLIALFFAMIAIVLF